MTFSVQQIKFECLSYIKDFGAKTEGSILVTKMKVAGS